MNADKLSYVFLIILPYYKKGRLFYEPTFFYNKIFFSS